MGDNHDAHAVNCTGGLRETIAGFILSERYKGSRARMWHRMGAVSSSG